MAMVKLVWVDEGGYLEVEKRKKGDVFLNADAVCAARATAAIRLKTMMAMRRFDMLSSAGELRGPEVMASVASYPA